MMTDIEKIIKYSKKMQLLYVEDNKETRESTLLILEEFFENIIVGINGKDGLEKFKNSANIDIIISDIKMPIMDGLEMSEQIIKINPSIPIFIFSAHNEANYFMDAIKIGVQGYLLKPLDIDQFVKSLDKSIETIELKKEIVQKNKKIEEEHKFLQSVIDNSYESIMVIKEDYTIDLMNKAIQDKIDTKYISDINNPKCYEVSHHRSTPCDEAEHICPLKNVMQSRQSKTVVHLQRDLDENIRHVEIAAVPLFDENDNFAGIIETSRDITEHIAIQEQLRKQKDMLAYKASHDTLTGLVNRNIFEDRLEQAILSAKRNKTKVALFFIDLDKFKQVNDSFGHKAGDYVLQSISRRMKQELREKDTLARIGGDEFILIIENINEVKDIEKLAKKLLNAIEKPIHYENNILNLSASIGISIYPGDSINAQMLLQYADTAMYRAKQGTENILYYSQIGSI